MTTKRVLLVGWPGAEWRLIEPLFESGEMPCLSALVDRGVQGTLGSLLPMVDPLLWTSIATGVHGDRHRILTHVEPDGDGDVRPVQSTSRQRKALWNLVSQAGLRSAVVGWPASHPAESIHGVAVSDRFPRTTGAAAELWPANSETVHPPELLDPLLSLRVHPEEISRAQLEAFVPELDRARSEYPSSIDAIAACLAQAASVQKAATWIEQRAPTDFTAVCFESLGALCRQFLIHHPAPESPASGESDGPPAVRDSSEGDGLFTRVVTTAYRLHDMMLARLLELWGPDTLVILVSDHGYREAPAKSTEPKTQETKRPDPGRDSPPPGAPRPAWGGILCAAGPGVREDELVFGGTLLDVAPTILAALGIPVPRDLDGKVLTKVFREAPAMDQVETAEAPAEGDGRTGYELAPDPWNTHEIVDDLASLGIGEADPENLLAVEICLQRRRATLAHHLRFQDRKEEALDAFRRVREAEDTFDTRIAIARCLLDLGRSEEAEAELDALAPMIVEGVSALVLRAKMAAMRGDEQAARRCLASIDDLELAHGVHALDLGWLALRLRELDRARGFFEAALQRDTDLPFAHDGLGLALLGLGRNEEAVYHHMEAVRHLHHRSDAHFNLGQALVTTGQIDWARQAFRNAANLDPGHERAREWLRRLDDDDAPGATKGERAS